MTSRTRKFDVPESFLCEPNWMSAIGTERTLMQSRGMSAFGVKADIADPLANVR